MTAQEAVLSRSPLPKDGTYTMVDHLLAAQMTVYGKVSDVNVSTGSTKVSVTEAPNKVKVSTSGVVNIVQSTSVDDVVVVTTSPSNNVVLSK